MPPPSAPPTILQSSPTNVVNYATSVSQRIDLSVGGITGGDGPLQFKILYGKTSPPTLQDFAATLVSPGRYKVELLGLEPNTKYYFVTQVSDGTNVKQSDEKFFITAPNNFFFEVTSVVPTTKAVTVNYKIGDFPGDSDVSLIFQYGPKTTNINSLGVFPQADNALYKKVIMMNSNTPDGKYEKNTSPDTIDSFIIPNLTPNTEYSYYIRINNNFFAGDSDLYNPNSEARLELANFKTLVVTPPSTYPSFLAPTITSTSIQINLNVAGITSNAVGPTSYYVFWGTTAASQATKVLAMQSQSSPSTFTVIIPNLITSTTYYFKASSSNGALPDPITPVVQSYTTSKLPPNRAPGGVGGSIGNTITQTTFTQNVNITGITGSTLSFFGVIGTTNPPDLNTNKVTATTSTNPTTRTFTFTGLIPNTKYWVRLVSTNGNTADDKVGDAYSFNTQANFAPTVIDSTVNFDSIILNLSDANKTGSGITNYFALFGTTAATLNRVNCVDTRNSGPGIAGLLTATINNLLPKTLYYVKLGTGNGNLDYVNPTALTFTTPSKPPSKTPIINDALTVITKDSITLFLNITGITGTGPFTYYVKYGTASPPTTRVNATVTGTIARINLTGLTSNTKYFLLSGVSDGTTDVETKSPFNSYYTSPVNGFSVSKKAGKDDITTTATSCTFSYEIPPFVGTSNINYLLRWGPRTTNVLTLQTGVTLIQGVTPNSTNSVTGVFTLNNLPSSSNLSFHVIASNNLENDRNKNSVDANSATITNFATIAPIPPDMPPTMTLISKTTTSMVFDLDTTGISGEGNVYYVLYGITNAPATKSANATLKTGKIFTVTITGLKAATKYFFRPVSSNISLTLDSFVYNTN
jgi:hypothetical protein